MPDTTGRASPYHLGWRVNGDSFDVALAVNRVLVAGGRAWRLSAAQAGLDAGDYLIELTSTQHAAVMALDLKPVAWEGKIPGAAQALNAAATLLFAGAASRFPYFAYYALCLLRLGVAYTPCDGGTLSNGALDRANLLILPGGFSTFGIDAAENAPGADAKVREFLADGGAAIGSCGGAYYLSAGRPGWTGTANALPMYTHEWLQSGVGIVSVALSPGPLAFGCPPSMDVPYYHGPLYSLLGPGISVAATFHELTLPGRLAIDNPLDREKFQRDMAGKPAILIATGNRGRAVLFSPHPEMGDLVRKYTALDGYVRHYLPIRGPDVMRETLRHYRVSDSPCFRLVQNAIDELMTTARPAPAPKSDSGGGHGDIAALCRREAAALPDFGPDDEGDLLRDAAGRICARINSASERAARALTRADSAAGLLLSWRHLAAAMAEHFDAKLPRPPAQHLMELELSIALMENWTRAAEFDHAAAGRA